MYQILQTVYLLIALGIIVLVLLQHGKGAELGVASGMGASSTLFGSTGSNRFMVRLTGLLIALFFALCLLLGKLNRESLPSVGQQKLAVKQQKTDV